MGEFIDSAAPKSQFFGHFLRGQKELCIGVATEFGGGKMPIVGLWIPCFSPILRNACGKTAAKCVCIHDRMLPWTIISIDTGCSK